MVESEGLSPEQRNSAEKHALVNANLHKGKADTGAVMSKILGEYPDLRGEPKRLAKLVGAIVREVNSMSSSDQVALLESRFPDAIPQRRKEPEVHRLPPLPAAVKGKAVFRLPPEPSGFMHIGHAMAFTVNSLYKDMYDGELWLRFEDTNPRKVLQRYYDSFREGIDWLGITCDQEKNVSDDMETMYEFGERMIRSGVAYACSCSLDKVKAMRFAGTPCEHRERPIEESLHIWEELLAKKHREGEYVIRFRGDMASANYSLRDPNVFRVIEHSHPLTGEKYTVWPTYDIANTIEDELCGVTHILRSSEFHTDLQRLIRQSFEFRPVEVIQFSRYNFKGTPVHKRLLRPLVEEKLVSGWDDPRMPTVEGVKRRGILPKTLKDFTLQVGYTTAEHEYDWSMLFSLNRKILDPMARRLYFVPDPMSIEVEGAPEREVKIPFHPEKDLGYRTIRTDTKFDVPSEDIRATKNGSLFRLMDLFNVQTSSKNGRLAFKYAGDEFVPETRKVQWTSHSNRIVTVLVPGILFNEAGEFNKESLKKVEGVAEESITTVGVGDIVQFPRFGFCRRDSPSTFILAHK